MRVADTITKIKLNKIALLDADYVKYIITNNIYKDIELEKETGVSKDYNGDSPAIYYTKKWLNDWFLKIKDPIIFCFSGKSYNTFRNHIAFDKKYKGNRVKSYRDYDNKTEDMYASAEYIISNFNSLLFNDLEADDILSMLQDNSTYIISKDKDLKQIPGIHYSFENNNTYEISNEQGLYNLAEQLIKGDTTDNISGLPKYGNVKAYNLLKDLSPQEYIPVILNEYQKKFGIFNGTDMFAETWMLVKMRPNRGKYLVEKYKSAFDLKGMILKAINV